LVLAAAAACAGFVATPAAHAVPPSAGCGPDEASALQFALAQMPFEPLTGRPWSRTPVASNYEPCADLSTILVMTEDGTGSSPVQALMFHRGQYLGTGTSKAYGFTELDTDRSTHDTVVLTYKAPGECNACPPDDVTSVRFKWEGDHAAMLDP